MIARRWLERFQVDRVLAYALVERVWQAVTGPVTVALVIWYLSESTTGLYTGIGNVIGIQNLFELGMLNVLIGHAGHATAAIRASSGTPEESDATQRMKTLVDASGRWFAIASVLFAFASIGFGWYTFTQTESADFVTSQTQWAGPLFCVVPLVALIVYLSPRLAILEGSGYRELIYKVRLLQRMTGTAAVWAALFLGYGIWSLVASTAVQLAWTIYLAKFKCRDFFRSLAVAPTPSTDDSSNAFSWSRDVLPAQWRAALVSMAHYLATQSFVFAALIFQSREDGGRLGLTLVIAGALQAVALAWVNTKYSVISDLHGADRRVDAGALWRKTAVISTSILAVGYVVLIGVLAMLPQGESMLAWLGFENKSLVTRFITPTQCAINGVGTVASHLIGLQAIYVLSRKSNPLTLPLMIGSCSAAAAVWIGGYLQGVTGLLTGYTIAMCLIALPVHTFAYLRFRKKP